MCIYLYLYLYLCLSIYLSIFLSIYHIYIYIYIYITFTYINNPIILDLTIMIVLLRHLTDPVKIVHCFLLIQWRDPLNSS